MSEHEPEWERDRRLKAEESRLVRLEQNVQATRTQADAIREMLDEERKSRRVAEERLEKHEADDAHRFASIDSRLMGTQTQLSTILDKLSVLDKFDNRIQVLEEDKLGRTAVERFLKSAWAQLAMGITVGAALMGLYIQVLG